MSAVLVTGASGNVGEVVVRALIAAGSDVRTATRNPRPPDASITSGRGASTPTGVRFDFTVPTTWGPAFSGIGSMFVVRPPALGNVRRDLLPALRAGRAAGVRHMVFLSLQGAEANPVVPHAVVESWLRSSGVAWTFVRPSFFAQNLSTTHAVDIRDRDTIVVPAGHGATAFVDADDVGAVAATALLEPEAHAHRAWTVTGPEALTYDEVADILTTELGRTISYATPGVVGYARHARRHLGMPWGMVAVTAAIYTTARLGLAAGLTDDVRAVLGREPIDFRAFARRARDAWIR